MNLSKSLFSGFVICFAFFAAPAQYRFDNWTTDNGLPQNSVYAVVQTRDDYIWLATLDGLVRFDGVRFTVFNKGNSPGIANNRFVNLFEDARGDLWAGTEQSGVVRYHNGQFTSYGLGNGLSSLRVVWLAGDPDGNVLVFPPGMRSAARWSGEEFVQFEPPLVSSPVLPGSAAGNVNRYIACETSPFDFKCFTNEGYQSFLYSDALPDFEMSRFNSAAQDANGAIWIPTRNRGLLKIENGRPVSALTMPEGVAGRPVRTVIGARLSLLSKGDDGSLWLTDTATMRNELLARRAPESFSTGFDVLAGFEDREGNIWFGTARSGLFRARRQFITTYSVPDGLTGNNVYPIFEDRRGVVWIGTVSGLFKYQNGVFSPAGTTASGDVNAIGEDSSGRMLFASDGIRTLEDDRPVKVFDVRPSIRAALAIHGQADGAVWIGGQGGIARIRDGITTYFPSADLLAGDEVKVIIDDNDGGVWIGIYGGLTHFKDGRFTTWTEKDGLPSQNIRSLYMDDEGVLWIGTYDGGLARFADGKFTGYSMENGLQNDGAFQILEDGRRNFWISSNRGIYRVSRDELNDYAAGKRSTIYSIGYGKSDGMLNAECNGGRSPAGTRTRDGRLWFPTQDGVAVIDPEKIIVNPNPPPVVIELLKIDNQPVKIGLLPPVAANSESAVEIRADQQSFEIEYTALSFINSENIRFKYKLAGLNKEWIEAGTRRTAYYSFVPPGEYTFRVIAANSDGVWNEEGKSLKITVLPPFYRTAWFLTMATLGFIGLAYSAFRFRINQVEKARKAQEDFSRKLLASQEQERQRIAGELHDSLGQSLLIIKNRIALAQTDIDEKDTVEEQLTELSSSAASAIEECREIAYNLRPFQISRFGLSKTLDGIFMRINEVTDINAVADIENIDHLLSDEAQTNVFRIVQECVNNIIKHSRASEALLTVVQNDGEITLSIEDNGRGFVPNEKASVRRPKSSRPKSGFGLIGIAERVKMLGGSYEIDSNLGEGTSIRVKLNTIKNDVS